MARIVCPGCGRKISGKMEKCPSCGYPVGMLESFGTDKVMCRVCGEENKAGTTVCHACGNPLVNSRHNDTINGVSQSSSGRRETAGSSGQQKTQKPSNMQKSPGTLPPSAGKSIGRISGAYSGPNAKNAVAVILTLVILLIMAVVKVVGALSDQARYASQETASGRTALGHYGEERAVTPDDSYYEAVPEDGIVEEEYYHRDMEGDTLLEERDGIRIDVTGLDIGRADGDIILHMNVSNASNTDIMVSGDGMAVNGIMVNPIMYDVVGAGEEESLDVTFYNDFKAMGILDVTDIELSVLVSDPDTYDEILRTEVTKFTVSGSEAYVQQYDDSGEVVYDQDGLRITYLGEIPSDGIIDPGVKLCVENHTGQDILLYDKNLNVNGSELMGTGMYSRIYPEGRAYADLCFYLSELEAADITEIEELDVEFYAMDAEDFNYLIESIPVHIDVK